VFALSFLVELFCGFLDLLFKYIWGGITFDAQPNLLQAIKKLPVGPEFF
tara:strand:- start:6 stop:152 length:147 start_codon:yes stop_codon:yes gene_type:complete